MTSLTTSAQNPLCGVCSHDVTRQQPAIILGTSKRTVHKSCFNCLECNISLVGQPKTYCLSLDEYKAKGGDQNNALNQDTIVPLCEQHYTRRCGTFCHDCKEILEGKFFKVGDKSYHPDCLKCFDCNLQVNTPEQPVKLSNNVIRCEACYDNCMYDKCLGCRRIIKAQFIRYGTSDDIDEKTNEPVIGKWHPECFTCVSCDVSLGSGDIQFIASKDDANAVFCAQCHRLAHAPRCYACSNPILEKSFLKINGMNYHQDCLACSGKLLLYSVV
jgi:hypothetical protein